ncbi:serine carboxypeptidase-like [Senna tora]|uniref:Serine carboxypeptidase-like n=1 Tax=Senna tora TaxID=362788 RepID=A0A834X0V8_9FABA|nr:serine carboxypeptidase-like [Senna tora]
MSSDVQIVKELPKELQPLDLEAIGSVVSYDMGKEPKLSFYMKNILPVLVNICIHYLLAPSFLQSAIFLLSYRASAFIPSYGQIEIPVYDLPSKILSRLLSVHLKEFGSGIPSLLEDGIKVLVYAGKDDLIYNGLGKWVHAKQWSGKKEFESAPTRYGSTKSISDLEKLDARKTNYNT